MRGSATPVRLLLLAAGAALLSCGGDATGPAGDIGSVSVSPSTDTITVGATTALQAVVHDADGGVVTGHAVFWNTEHPDIATVSDDGVVTGVAPGEVEIAASVGGRSGSCTVTVLPPPVASVTIDPSSASLRVGETVQLEATTADATGHALEGRAVTWSSSNDDVASVSDDGFVRAIEPGSAVITGKSEGRTGFATITVGAIPVASVDISPATATVFIGATHQLTATPRDAQGNALSGRSVQWFSDNTPVASVSGKGVATAKAVGTATITATSEGQSGTATVAVQAVPVASVAIDPSSAAITVGETVKLSATVRDADDHVLTGREVAWGTSDDDVATVNDAGLVTGVATGSVTITATSEGKHATAKIQVKAQPVASVTITPGNVDITVGQTAQLSATVRDAGGRVLTGRTVEWSSNHEHVARVSRSGLVTGVADGEATITATSEGKSGTATITVKPVPVAAVEVHPKTASLTVGATTQLSVTVKDASGATLTGRTVTWSSNDDRTVTVDDDGTVTGVAEGTATITATSEGKRGTATITVQPAPVASVDVDPGSASLTVGDTRQFTATPKDAQGHTLSGRSVAWSSDDPAVASVSGKGVVTAKAEGTATITATSEGKSGTATVTVTRAPVASVDVTPPADTIVVGGATQLSATVRDASGNVLQDREVTWRSNDRRVATVDGTGMVTGVALGHATITATSEGRSGTAEITVQPVPVASVTVTPPAPRIVVGSTVQLTATPEDATGAPLMGREVTWSTSDPAIATVDDRGRVTGVAAGSATITATSEGKTGTATVTVLLPPVGSVTVSPSLGLLMVGGTLQLTAVLRDDDGNVLDGRTVTWTSSAGAVATVSMDGLVTAQAPGIVTITATSEGKSGSALLTVTPGPPPPP